MGIRIAGQDLDYRMVNATLFNVKEGLAMSRVLDFCTDTDGFIWTTSERGVQIWDGSQFNNVDTLRNDFVKIVKHPKSGIIAINDKGIYWLNFQKKIIGFYDLDLNARTVVPIDLIRDSFYLVNDKELIAVSLNFEEMTRRKAQFDTENQLHIGTIKYKKHFRQTGVVYAKKSCFSSIEQVSGYEVNGSCYYPTKTGLVVESDSDRKKIPYPEQVTLSTNFSILETKAKKRLLVAINNRLFEFDSKRLTWTKEWLDMNNEPLLTTGYYDKLIEDRFGSIWGITVTEGLIKININEDFGYIGSNLQKINFIKNIALDPSSNKVLVAGLNNGIVVFDTLGNFVKQFSINTVTDMPMNVTGVYNIGPNEYIFNEERDQNIYHLILTNTGTKMAVFGEKNRTYLYYQSHVDFDHNTMYFGFDGLYKYDKVEKKILMLKDVCHRNTSMTSYKHEVYSGCSESILIYNTIDDSHEEVAVKGTQYIRGIAVLTDSIIAYTGDKGLHTINRYTNEIKDIYTDGVGYNLAKDKNGNLWLGTDKGLVCVQSNGEQIAFLPEDGIQSLEFNTNAIAMSNSGKLYLGGINGITTFDPSNIELVNNAPLLYIKNLKVNNKVLWSNKIQGIDERLTLEHDQKTIEINAGAMGKHNEFKYSYSLNGGDWVDNGVLSRFIFSLAPGDYCIDIKAHPRLQIKNTSTKRINLFIKKPWWNQLWFYASAILTLLISFGLVIYYFQKRKLLKSQEALRVKQKLSDERMKISRDLHDNIGSQLSYLTSSLDNLRYEIDDRHAIQKIDDLKGYGKTIIQDLRNMIWVLHHDEIAVEDLHFKILDLISFVQVANPSTKVNYDVNLEEQADVKINAIKAGHLFKMTQEVLHNGIKYSEVEELHLTLSIKDETLELCYEDQGIGFDQDKLGKDNFGLLNLKSRTEELHGTINITSARTQGVGIQISVPL